MKLLAVCIFLLSLNSFALTDSSVVCDRTLKATSPIFENALTNIYSFQYVHHALEQLAGPETVFCTSQVVLTKNTYQYYESLIAVDVYQKGTLLPQYRIRLVFQNASVQAFHNVGGQPWAGVSAAGVDQAFKNLLAPATFKHLTTAATSAIDIVRGTPSFQKDFSVMDANSVSAMPVSISKTETVFLVTWLTRYENDIFAGAVITKGAFVKISANSQVSVAENIYPQGDLLTPLEDQVEALKQRLGPVDAWAAQLLKISVSSPPKKVTN